LRNALPLLCLCAALALCAVATVMALAPDDASSAAAFAPPIDRAEHARAIAALRPATRERTVVALMALNRGTEVADLLTSYGILRQGDAVDVIVVAETPAPIRLYPGDLRVLPQTTFAAFDRAYPHGADYVIVPAQDPYDDRAALDWLRAQSRGGAHVVAICNGAQTVGAAGLLDGRVATSHWSTVQALRDRYPTMRWARDRRYVTDRGVTTSTGVSSSLPLMLALTEAAGGAAAAERTAQALGIASWDARHVTAAFRLTTAHKRTYLRNKLRIWTHRDLPLPLTPNIDEIALGLTVDAYARTEMRRIVSTSASAQVRSRRGLTLLAGHVGAGALQASGPSPVPSISTGRALDEVLTRIRNDFDVRTARYVALTLEYPWRAEHAASP